MVRPFRAMFVSTSPSLLRRNNANQIAVNDEDSADTDGVMNMTVNEDQDASFTVDSDGDEDFAQSTPCRVMSPTRRPWATSQDESAIRLRMDMPGIAKENVKVYIDNMKLVVQGRYPPLSEEVLDEDHVLADNVGVYTAEVILPENVQTDKIKSELKDGILLVTAPKGVTFISVD